MRKKKPRRAPLDEVRITRQGGAAIIEHADPTVSTAHLTIGPQLGSMSASAVLDLLNATIAAQEILASEYDHTLVEMLHTGILVHVHPVPRESLKLHNCSILGRGRVDNLMKAHT